MIFWKTRQEYAPLSDDSEQVEKQQRVKLQLSAPIAIAACLLIVILVACAGFSLGYWAASQQGDILPNGLLKPSGNKLRTYTYNSTFANAEREESHALLMSQAPSRSGFIRDPLVAPVIGIPGFFHQLHCLWGIQQGYKAVLEGLTVDRMTDSDHMAHCFEYLRNAILCAADSNIEPFNVERGGVNGWSKHQCRDFERILAWSREHALSEVDVHEFYLSLHKEGKSEG